MFKITTNFTNAEGIAKTLLSNALFKRRLCRAMLPLSEDSKTQNLC